MSPQRTIQTPTAPQPVGAYSQGKQVGPFLQVSGQLAIDTESGQIIAGEAHQQTVVALRHVESVLEAGGVTWADVLVVRAYLATDNDFDAFNQAYAEVVPAPYPARVVVGAELAPGALVEIDALAVVETDNGHGGASS